MARRFPNEFTTEPAKPGDPQLAAKPQPIESQLAERALYWQRILLAVADGNHASVEALKQLDVFEFYTRRQAWQLRIEAQIEQLNKK